jgi:hypothetical protein
MAIIYLRRTVSGLAVADGDLLEGWKLGDVLRADIVKPRNGGLHRKAFALVKLIYPHTDYGSLKALRDAMTVGAGYVDIVVNPMTGEAGWTPRSWEFTNMDNIEFEALFNRLVDVAMKLLGKSTREDRDELERHIVSF